MSESKINTLISVSQIDQSENSKKSIMTSSAKEFVPKQKISIDKPTNIGILPDEQKQKTDYVYSDVDYENQFNCGNLNECALNENENCLSEDLYSTSCNQTTPIRPSSLNMNSSNLCDSNVYQTMTIQNPPIYSMDPSINTYYGCITGNPETINSVNYMTNPVMTTASPVIVQQSSTPNLNLFQPFHNSGGSSPHSYQSVSPPINNSTFPLSNTNNGSNPSMGGEHYVMVHVNLGETFSIRVGDQIQNISGPATVRMVSNSGPPTPMPMQVPPGHMVQQIVDENGILTHVILSPLHQPAQCLGPHVQHIHPSNSQSPFFAPNQTNPSMPIYTNNYPLYTNGSNITQSINVNNQLSNGQGVSSVTTNVEGARSSYVSKIADKSNVPRIDRLSKDKLQNTDYSLSSQNNIRFSESKNRQIKHRTHQYHHSPQIDDSSFVLKMRNNHAVANNNENKTPDSNYNYDKSMNNSSNNNTTTNNNSLNNFNRDDGAHDSYSGHTSLSHYPKYRKKRPYSNSASANSKHHFIPNTNISPTSSADEAGTILTDEEKKAIRDVLNTIEKPEVSEIEARSALIHIISPSIPDNCIATINSGDFTFQLHFAERNPDSRYNCVFYGEAVEISLQDLKPATDYYVKVCTIYENITGNLSSANKFTTLSAEPNQPKQVQLQTKTRNSLQVKWTAPIENGSRITEFILEYCRADSKIDNYIEAYRGIAKTFKISKLKPSTEYLIRLLAINTLGSSPWSDPLSVLTSGTAPLPPDPPSLARADIGGLLLTWKKRPTDETFCLEMMDEATGYGFITVFNGPEIEHYVENLRRNTNYRFHLAASNQDGRSKWSEVVTHSTKPDLPSPPQKLHVRGKVHSTNFVLVWDEPEDDGGLPVIAYKLELDINSICDNQTKPNTDGIVNDSDCDWVNNYEGIEREYNCKNLTPGSMVLARVSAKSSVGTWGEPCTAITVNLAATPPGQMLPPRKDIGNKSKTGILAAGGINLSWEKPENDGGSSITSYELCQWLLRSKSKVTSTDVNNSDVIIEEYFEEIEEQVVYSGSQLHCQITGLIPGAQYRYRIRAINKAGYGKWSNNMDATSGPSAPEAPSEAPVVQCKSPHSAMVMWKAPTQANGSQIIEYRLESKLKSDLGDFQLIYCGPQLSYEAKNLLPDSCYRYRVQAVNRAGFSLYSPICDVVTPASVPAQVTNLRTSTISMQSIQLLWKEPANNGSLIVNYCIEVTCCSPPPLSSTKTNHSTLLQESFTVISESTDKVVIDLLPDTNYKFRVQAVNNVGSGPFCPNIKSSTLSPPPSPPRLECLNVQSNSIKLRWHNDISARQYYINRLLGLPQTPDKTISINSTELNITQYVLQMSRQPDTGWSTVYTGTMQFHKLGKLLESTTYYFRIMASNEIGEGDSSEPFKVVTEKAAPSAVRAPKVSEICTDSCLVEWPPLRSMNQDPIVYILQLLTISEKDCDYRQLWKNNSEVYRGSDVSCRVSSLSPGTEYMTRVCAVRLCSPSTITEDRIDDSPVHLRRNNGEQEKFDKSVIRFRGNSSPVTELLGPFSKSVPFTTLTSNNQRLSYGTGSQLGNMMNSDKLQYGSGQSCRLQIPTIIAQWRDSIGPLTDSHFIVLILFIFICLVIFLANLIQNYVK